MGRRDRARAGLAEHGVEALLVTAPANVRWLTGFSGSMGQVLLAPDAGGDRLVTDHRYEERAAVEAPDIAVALTRDPISVALAPGFDRLG
ncbi:MAG: aminopeptidase P family N-terminal domain-containing protein, partial [Egicoccus sp.]